MLTILSPSFTHICIFTLLEILAHFSHVAGYVRRKMTAVSEGGPEGGAQGPRLSQLTETREAAGSNSETSLILQKLVQSRAGIDTIKWEGTIMIMSNGSTGRLSEIIKCLCCVQFSESFSFPGGLRSATRAPVRQG